MFKFGPLLAYALAFKIANYDLINLHKQLVKNAEEKGDFSLLDIGHHISCG